MPTVLDPPRSPLTRGANPKKSDAACFSPIADRARPEEVRCSCSKPALGATAIEFESSVMGRALGKFRFFCFDCQPKAMVSLTVSLMYPAWKVVSSPEPGVYWLRHRTEKEQYETVTP